jgi:hypothetical protein
MKYLTHPEDCRRIQEACLKHCWDISLSEADVMWGWHSMGQSCGWSSLPTTLQAIWERQNPNYKPFLVEYPVTYKLIADQPKPDTDEGHATE